MTTRPLARNDESVFVQPFGDDLMLFDSDNHRYYHLNPTACIIWRHCDGQHTLEDLAQILTSDSSAAREEVVWEALQLLERAGLLADFDANAPEQPSRLAFLSEAISTGAPLLAAMVLCVTAPTVAHAQSMPFCNNPRSCSRVTAHLFSPGSTSGGVNRESKVRWWSHPSA